MSRSTKVPELPGPMTSRREFLKRLVVMGAALPLVGSLLAACGGDDDDDDAPAAESDPDPTATTASATATETPEEEPSPTAAGTPEAESSPTQPDASPEPTTEPDGTPTAQASPTSEYPAVGALGPADGAVKWSVNSPEEAFRTVIGASGDVVLIGESGPIEASGSASRQTIAFAAADGSELWRRSTGEMPTPPGPIDGQGIVVLADQDAGALVGVDVMTGEERWRVESNEAPLANSPTIAVVWNASSQFSPVGFRGIDRATGEERWASDTMLSDQSGIFVGRSPAAVLDEIVVVPTGDTVTAIDMQTGEMLWEVPQLDHLAAADGTVVGARGTNGPPTSITVTAVDAASGQERWTAPGVPSYGGFLAVGGGVLAVDSGSRDLIAYELSSGNERWRMTRTVRVDPQMISGTSLILLWEGELAVLSTTDGTTIWSATEPFGSPLMNSVGSNGDAVFVAINSRPWAD